jgi:hypothetical protein
MSEFLKKLHEELSEILGYNEKEPAPTKSKKVVEDDEEETTPVKTKKNAKVYTMEQVKKKAREVLEKKGVKVAKGILEQFGAEKVGDLDEDDFEAVIDACDKALKAKKTDEDEDDDL